MFSVEAFTVVDEDCCLSQIAGCAAVDLPWQRAAKLWRTTGMRVL